MEWCAIPVDIWGRCAKAPPIDLCVLFTVAFIPPERRLITMVFLLMRSSLSSAYLCAGAGPLQGWCWWFRPVFTVSCLHSPYTCVLHPGHGCDCGYCLNTVHTCCLSSVCSRTQRQGRLLYKGPVNSGVEMCWYSISLACARLVGIHLASVAGMGNGSTGCAGVVMGWVLGVRSPPTALWCG